GLGLSWLATRSLAVLGAANLPKGIPIAVDWRVMLFMVAVSVITGLAFGMFPALQLSRTDMNSRLRDEGRGTSAGRARAQVKNVLVVCQVAFSLVMLIIAGLLVRSFGRLLRVDPGFDSQNVLTMSISLPTVKYAKPEQQVMFFDEFLRKLSAVPGIQSASVSAPLPLSPIRITPILPEGQQVVPLAQRPFIIVEATSPKFLETMHIPLQAGRAFTDADNAQAPTILIINRALTGRLCPKKNPIRKNVMVRRDVPEEVVGLASDVMNQRLAQPPQPQFYVPYAQLPWPNMNLYVRTATDPHNM